MAEQTDGRLLGNGELLDPSAFSGTRARGMNAIAKRGFDIAAALAILLVVSPVMLGIWLIVRLDGGPGLYGHPRVGRGNREFRCLKFRTMVTNGDAVLQALLVTDEKARAEWQRSRKLVNDPRVTRIGRVLRASSLDEVPQLFNVLRGDMSLVGPRPVVRAEIDQFYHGADRSAYLSVRPGLTGLWQISGRSDASYDQRVRLDREYVNTATFRRDVTILLRTVAVVLGRRGAY
jgi:undecaprenyl-phosphate galactose phosphotransferase